MKAEEIKKRSKRLEEFEHKRELMKSLVDIDNMNIDVFYGTSDNAVATILEADFPKVMDAVRSAATSELARINTEIARLELDDFRMVEGAPPNEAEGEFLVEFQSCWEFVRWVNRNGKMGWVNRNGFFLYGILSHRKLPAK